MALYEEIIARMKSEIRQTTRQIFERCFIRSARRELPGYTVEQDHHALHEASYTLVGPYGEAAFYMKIRTEKPHQISILAPSIHGANLHEGLFIDERGHKTSFVRYPGESDPLRFETASMSTNVLERIWDACPKSIKRSIQKNGLPDNEAIGHFLCFVTDAYQRTVALEDFFCPPPASTQFAKRLYRIPFTESPQP